MQTKSVSLAPLSRCRQARAALRSLATDRDLQPAVSRLALKSNGCASLGSRARRGGLAFARLLGHARHTTSCAGGTCARGGCLHSSCGDCTTDYCLVEAPTALQLPWLIVSRVGSPGVQRGSSPGGVQRDTTSKLLTSARSKTFRSYKTAWQRAILYINVLIGFLRCRVLSSPSVQPPRKHEHGTTLQIPPP